MTWVKIDDGFTRNPKIHRLPDDAFRFHVAALCYCAAHLTDGVIHRSALKMLQSDANLGRKWLHVPRLLVDSGVWKETDSGYVVNDYLEYNPDRQTVISKREANAQRQRDWRDKQLESNAVTPGARNAVTNTPPSRPVPKTLRQPVDNSGDKIVFKGSWCNQCKALIAPGVNLEDHTRISHGVPA